MLLFTIISAKTTIVTQFLHLKPVIKKQRKSNKQKRKLKINLTKKIIKMKNCKINFASSIKFCTIVIICHLIFSSNDASAQGIRWISSTKGKPWVDMTRDATANENQVSTSPVIKLDPHTTFQVIDGFGGCFNELGWQAILAMSDVNKRETVLKELFDPQRANFTLGRVPIGANDFSLKWYSLNETAGDFNMKHFSIERDRQELIPFVKAAMRYQSKLGIWGVPWCPPSWMTTTEHYKHGHIKTDAKTLSAYALYFAKYVKEYRAEGLNLYAIMPQNEACYDDNIYPQCQWTGEELNIFLRDYLLPGLKKQNVKIEVWHGTITGGKEPMSFITPVLNDPITNPQITGIGLQYIGPKITLASHEKYPDKKIAQTETECYNGKNTWDEGLTTFRKIIENTKNYVGSYFFWNMVLNESALSSWNWAQNSLITIDRKKDSIIFNPEFYAMKHFSSMVLPGAKHIALNGSPFQNTVAFSNPSGEKVVAFLNENDQTILVEIENKGKRFKLEVPAKSMNTIVLSSK